VPGPLIATHGTVAELVDALHSDCGARNGRESSTLSGATTFRRAEGNGEVGGGAIRFSPPLS
jgi:hypothetical protein